MSKSLSLLVKHWKSLFASDKFSELFLELGQHLNSRSEAFNQFVHLQHRYNKAQKNEMEGTVSRENTVLEYNQINKALIDAIDELQASDLGVSDTGLDELKPVETLKKPTAKEEHAWEFTTDADTRAAYEKYLTRFPDGFYASNARERLDYFDADDTAWEFATDSGSEKAIQKYLDKYPNGLHVAEAQQKIATFERERQEALKKRAQAIAERRGIDPFYDLMVPIKGGTFEMGDTFGEGGSNEKPVHKVTLSDYWLCKYPVTQGLWEAIMGENNNPSRFKSDDLLPVEQVSWDDAQEFIHVLNKKTGGQYRLPTEAEWEYAARAAPSPTGESRGGAKVRFGNGKDIANPSEMNFCALKEYKQPYSVVGEYRAKTTPVNQFKPNKLGLYDMAGNVYDWCADWFSEDYYQQCHAQGTVLNPQGPDTGAYRVLRGGDWGGNPRSCRAAYRDHGAPVGRYGNVGFRVASSLQ